jgi:hypothetical protein
MTCDQDVISYKPADGSGREEGTLRVKQAVT